MRNKTKKHFRKNRLGNLIWYDLNYGYQCTRLKWLGAVLVQAYFAIMAARCYPSPEVPIGMPGYVEFLFRGLPEYFVSETGRFELPVPWLMLHAYVLFLTVSYPAEDLVRSGGQAIVRAGRRRDWLLGKAAWVACSVAGYYLLLAGMLFLCALAVGGLARENGIMGNPATEYVAIEDLEPENAATEGLMSERLTGQNRAESQAPGDWEISLRCLGQSLLVSLTLCLTELVFSLILEPALSLFLMLTYTVPECLRMWK